MISQAEWNLQASVGHLRATAPRWMSDETMVDAAHTTMRSLRTTSGVPRRNLSWAFDNLTHDSGPEKAMHEEVKHMAERVARKEWGRPCILALAGGNGTGKTLTASCAVRYCIERLIPAKIITFMGMVEALRAQCYDGDTILESALTKLARTINLLVIDELDKCRGMTTDEWMLLVRLIEKREMEPHTGTILITNWKEDEWKRRCGASVESRVGKVIHCNWQSRRTA